MLRAVERLGHHNAIPRSAVLHTCLLREIGTADASGQVPRILLD